MEKELDKYDFLFGIDPGVKTGVARIDLGSFDWDMKDFAIHDAMSYISDYKSDILVLVEDARLWNGHTAGKTYQQIKAASQGAGSVKRDSQIWGDFLKAKEIDHVLFSPKFKGAKLDHETFCERTGWTGGQTNQHKRDAAVMMLKYLQIMRQARK